MVDIANDLGISYTITYHNNYGNCVTINNSYDCQRMRDEIAKRSTAITYTQDEYYPENEYREKSEPTILGYILILVVLWWLADTLKSE